MPRVFRTRRARQDLIGIWRYVADDDPDAADRLLDTLDSRCASLNEHPQLGPARDDIRPGMRCLVEGEYLILYRTVDEGVEIVRVVHGKRHLPGLF